MSRSPLDQRPDPCDTTHINERQAMTDFVSAPEMKQMMMIEALESYIQRLKDDNCNQAAIEAFTKLLNEVEEEIW